MATDDKQVWKEEVFTWFFAYGVSCGVEEFGDCDCLFGVVDVGVVGTVKLFSPVDAATVIRWVVLAVVGRLAVAVCECGHADRLASSPGRRIRSRVPVVVARGGGWAGDCSARPRRCDVIGCVGFVFPGRLSGAPLVAGSLLESIHAVEHGCLELPHLFKHCS